MNDFGDLLDVVLEMRRDLDEHKVATRNMLQFGAVVDRDLQKGVRLQTGTDEDPHKTAWGPMADRSGASSYTPKNGEHCLIFCPFGDSSQGIVIPFGHNGDKPNPAKDVDETVHHARDGQDHRVKDGHVKNQADDKHSQWTGGEEPGDKAGAGGNFPHELQRQLQGLRAGLTQAQHNIAGLHDVTSKFRQLVLPFVPAVAALEGVLNGDPSSLKAAAEGVLGKLEGYIALDFEGMLDKLTNGLLDNVQGVLSGIMSGNIGALLDEVEDMAAGAGVDIAGALSDARDLVEDAAAGVEGALDGPLGLIEGALAGSPAGAAFGELQGRIADTLGTAGKVAAGLGDLLGGQKNIVKGLTRSLRLGGY